MFTSQVIRFTFFQITHMGFKADVIVWDFKKKEPYATFTLHKVKVEALAFSPSDKYLVTLGGTSLEVINCMPDCQYD